MRARIVTILAMTLSLGFGGVGFATAQAAQRTGASGAEPSAASRPHFFEAKLTGANEVNGGAPNGSATGVVRIQDGKVTFAFVWSGISAPLAGHIHQAVAGTNGPVVVPFFGSAMPAGVSAAAGSVTIADPTLAGRIVADPSGFYLNLHTKEFPGGAVRGQLTRPNPFDLFQVLGRFVSGDLTAVQSGANEVKGGDPNGHAIAFVRAHGTQVDFAEAWQGLTGQPVASHIHMAPAGVAGPVVVPFYGTQIPDNVFAVAGTVTGVDPALVEQINAGPQGFYVNMHTAAFPAGAVRGQLHDQG
jgi:hypothetical protein